MHESKLKGYFGEALAVIMLLCKGYSILSKRFKTKYGEIDIIAKKRNTIVFVEVKARKTISKCVIAITQQQLRRIQNSSEIFLARHTQYSSCDRRYDVIFIADWRLPMHIQNISDQTTSKTLK